jgi:hypothetical protein
MLHRAPAEKFICEHKAPLSSLYDQCRGERPEGSSRTGLASRLTFEDPKRLRDPPCQAIARVVDFEALVQIAHGFRSIIHGSSQIIGGVSQHISDGVAESGRIMQSPKPEVSIEQQFSIVQCLDVCLVDDGRHTVAIERCASRSALDCDLLRAIHKWASREKAREPTATKLRIQCLA